MPPHPLIGTYISGFGSSPLGCYANIAPWRLVSDSVSIVRALLLALPSSEYHIAGEVAAHRTTIVEGGATLKGPLILGPECFVASGAYLRGGSWVAAKCILGPGTELKSSFVFARSRLAHFNFVGDSILGEDVNLEAGSLICNYRNERSDKEVRVRDAQGLHATGQHKFGALVGDHSRIGANAVLAPGTLLGTGSVVSRGALLDQEHQAPTE
jgi:UDP-N-acetylglucosamine diphosphorylase / glucose-1-phosphate thymidylyltransferase / UDP-N-acetylgalactosamine diphosphorylase / glucosamine-1-phosphate N-acetyltransferase / galactosamine-1-phosphate N-acetyltransferase